MKLHKDVYEFGTWSISIGSLKSPTIIYEDNDPCASQVHMGYTSTITKHIAPNIFYPHEIQKKKENLIFCR
jgi:hypothetical protein